MARKKLLRYIVTGPGLEETVPSYADPGPALSRSLTAAQDCKEDGTWYVRDSITDKVLGYSERTEKVIVTVRH